MIKKIEYERSLLAKRPDLGAEWAYDRNEGLRPDGVSAFSKQKAWWACGKGHFWQSTVQSRANGCGCPYCSKKRLIIGENDFATKHPELLSEWDYKMNEGLHSR